MRRTWSSINTPFWPGFEPRVVAWQSITLPLRYASSVLCWMAFNANKTPKWINQSFIMITCTCSREYLGFVRGSDWFHYCSANTHWRWRQCRQDIRPSPYGHPHSGFETHTFLKWAKVYSYSSVLDRYIYKLKFTNESIYFTVSLLTILELWIGFYGWVDLTGKVKIFR